MPARNQTDFTLIELMIVVAIIGILAATGLNTALAGQTVVFAGAGATSGVTWTCTGSRAHLKSICRLTAAKTHFHAVKPWLARGFF